VTWTEEQSDHLRSLWAEGFSCSQIADKIGGLTRNSVIGRVHRMGLSRRAKTPNRSRTTESSIPRIRRMMVHGKHRFLRNIPVRKPAVIIDSDIPLEQRRTFMQLGEHECKFPIGDGVHMFFCGGPAIDGSVYCAGHHTRCYQLLMRRHESRPWRDYSHG
jgi:GcrA cell cycle regulator